MITCIFEHGKKTALRHVVVNILVLKDDKILLGKRAESLPEGGKWGIIGGFMDRDETLVQAAARETLEETGYKVHSLKLLHIFDNPNRRNEDRQNVGFLYIATPSERVGKIDDETTELKWFDLDKLPPLEVFAFDHRDHIETYKKYLREPFPLPLVGKI